MALRPGIGVAPSNLANPLDPRIVNYPLAPHNDRAADWAGCVKTSPLDTTFNTLPTGQGVNPTNCTGYHKKNSQIVVSLRMNYALGNGVDLTSLTSYQHFNEFQPIANDGIIYQDYENLQTGHIDVVYQELRASGKLGDRGLWIIGGNYEADDSLQRYLESYADSTTGPSFGLPLITDTISSRVHSSSASVFDCRRTC